MKERPKVKAAIFREETENESELRIAKSEKPLQRVERGTQKRQSKQKYFKKL